MATKVTVGPGDQARLVEQELSVTITDDTYVDIPGLAFDMRGGQTYQFAFTIPYSSDGTDDDMRVDVSGPAALTGILDWSTLTLDGTRNATHVAAALSGGAVVESAQAHAIVGWRTLKFCGKLSNAVDATFQVQARQNADGADSLTVSNAWGEVRLASIAAV